MITQSHLDLSQGPNVAKRNEQSLERETTELVGTLRMICLFASIFVMTGFIAPLLIIAFPLVRIWDPRRHLLHSWAIVWAKGIVSCNPWWKFRIMGKENIPAKNRAVMFVSNHQSQTDILALYLSGTQFRWLSKDTIFKFPVLGWAMRCIGYVPVTRGDKGSHARCMEESRQHLANGTSMVFFPEGTRSKDGTLGVFKSGAFKLAAQTGTDIVPITIMGSDFLLPKHSLKPRRASVDILFHAPIAVKGKSADELMVLARDVIASGLPADKRG